MKDDYKKIRYFKVSDKRKKELEIVKKLIKENIKDNYLGLFDTRNIVGDPMEVLFDGEYFTLKLCWYYSYFELFGCKTKEFKEVYEYYKSLGGR